MMERQLKIIAYLLAKNISYQTGEPIEDILTEAVSAMGKEEEAGDDEVERIYRLYPAKCPVRGTTTGKNAKNKLQIKRLLQDHSVGDLEYIVKRYVDECTRNECYIKNFSTFLNQLPDYSEEQDIFSRRHSDASLPQQ